MQADSYLLIIAEMVGYFVGLVVHRSILQHSNNGIGDRELARYHTGLDIRLI